ncbi:hypothetical protein G6O69_12835 [Pseudenhygromyxa sp. WMMC2535]|uniref:hypothetical protein n=1 Tax=Pseudenhygromyxa sp. WMMC2535 TaxID=2712867 RepID=UPI001557D7BB|nr:hypothetical protein [Pseudenhygromyxa sp. WMMC2535]NVB38719.1 hypothetical protein [Pseudenhygromyxa sp. WMMC2535]
MPRALALRCALACTALFACTAPGDEDSESADEASEAGDAGFVSLIDHANWITVDAPDDPLVDERPESVECGIAGWYIEGEDVDDPLLEVDTTYCNYLALSQPSLAQIREGAEMEFDFYHFNLTAPEPAQAHLAVHVDGELLWETWIDIPGSAQVFTESFTAPFDAPEGASVMMHLHNHGQNTWGIQDLRVWVEE